MNKPKTLLIGCGKAGNKLVNEMINNNKIYSGLFVNTAYRDMATLNNFSEESAFLFNAADGSGRNREISKEYVKGQIKALVAKINEYPLSKNIIIFTSADGGSGSGMTPILIQLLHKSFKMSKKVRNINLVAILPDFKIDDRIAFENTLSFWNEILDIKDECLNDIKFIDNSKFETYSEINERAVVALNNSYSMNGQDDIGDIDDRDSEIFNTCKGFGLILDLKDGFDTAKEAIDDSIKNSVFALPNNYNCQYLAISTKESQYKFKDIRECFDVVLKTTYKTYNKKHNTIVLGGCSYPNEAIELINERLKELNQREAELTLGDSKSLKVDIGSVFNKKVEKHDEVIIIGEDELNDIASALEDLFG